MHHQREHCEGRLCLHAYGLFIYRELGTLHVNWKHTLLPVTA